jgi:aspartate oxidase
MEHQMLYNHVIATLEITVVHETVQPELNMYHQKAQQIGEIVVNGLKMINKMAQNGELPGQGQGKEGEQELTEDQKLAKKTEQEMKMSDMKHQQKMTHEMQLGLLRLQNIKQAGEAKMVAEAQKAMSGLVSKDAEATAKLQRMKMSQI